MTPSSSDWPRPPADGAGTPAVHPESACRGAPANPPPAAAHGHRRSPPILNRLVGGATRARRHQRRARAGAAGDAVDARDLDGFGEGHICQDSG
jgi:hypothetical protein